MRRSLGLVGLLVLLVPLWSGCLAADEETVAAAADAPAPAPVVSPTTGSVTGVVVSADYLPLAGAAVSLYHERALWAEVSTDAVGRYTFNGVAPGTYRIDAFALGHRGASERLDVQAGAIVEADLVLERQPSQLGYHVPHEWVGFLGCGVGVPLVSLSACSKLYGDYGLDPNDEFVKTFELDGALRDVVVGATWRYAGGFSAERLLFEVHIDRGGQWVRYATAKGPPPVLFNVNDTVLAAQTDPPAPLASLEDKVRLQIRVYVPRDVDVPVVVYQQPFRVYMDTFHRIEAPAGHDPIPDQ